MRNLLISTGYLLVVSAATAGAAPVKTDHVTVELVSDNAALAPGKSVWLGLHLIHEAHWHTYWINPGDSGLPTKLTWTLPPNYTANEIAWPTPERFAVGDLYNFGYDGDVLLPVKIDVPASAKDATTAHVAVEAKWLVCREECVPGKADLTIDLPVNLAPSRNPRNAKLFNAAHARQPQAAAWDGKARVRGDHVEVTLSGPAIPTAQKLDAFVAQRRVVGNAPPQITASENGLTLIFPKSEYFAAPPAQLDLLLRNDDDTAVHAWSVTLPFDIVADHP